LLINDRLECLEAALPLDLYCESIELHSEKTMCSNIYIYIYIYILYSHREYMREWDREGKKDNPQL